MCTCSFSQDHSIIKQSGQTGIYNELIILKTMLVTATGPKVLYVVSFELFSSSQTFIGLNNS